MKVLLLNAGAKSHGATQSILETIREVLPDGWEEDMVRLGELDVHFCRGCKVCYETCTCVQKDDVQTLLSRMDEADVLIIAAPSYWGDIPAQFKAFIDRCTPYSNTCPNSAHKTLRSGKKCFGVALRAGTRPGECQHIIETIAHWCGHMEIEMVDSMYFCQINEEQDINPRKSEIRQTAGQWFSKML